MDESQWIGKLKCFFTGHRFRVKNIVGLFRARMKTKSWTFRYRWGFSLEINLEVWVLIPTIIITSREIAITWLCALFQVERGVMDGH